MAINIPIISQFDGAGMKSAKAAFANFKTDVGNATGAMGKFKAGSNAALKSVKANAGAFALAGGAAIAGFGIKAMNAFEDLAIASGKFADATGLTVEQASRFIEVGGDIGIEMGTIETAIGKVNKVLGATPELFKELGVEVVRSSGGVTDVNATFLNVIQRLKDIKDPAQRATVASQLLGKGWQGMAELIVLGSDDIIKALDKVSKSKVITADELIKAKNLRAAKDRWGDFFEDILITTGMGMADIALELDKGWGNVALTIAGKGDSLNEIYSKFPELDPDFEKVTLDLGHLSDMYEGAYGPRIKEAREETEAMTQAIRDQEDGVTTLTTEWQTLLGTLDTREAFDNLDKNLEEVFKSGIAAFGGTAEEVRKFNADQKDAIDQIADIAIALDLTFGEQNRLKIFVDSGDLTAAGEYLKTLSKGFGVDLGFGVGIQGARALGGPVKGGSSYLVGERGAEIFTPTSSGNITPNSGLYLDNTQALSSIKKVTQALSTIKTSYEFSVEKESDVELARTVNETKQALQVFANRNPVLFSAALFGSVVGGAQASAALLKDIVDSIQGEIPEGWFDPFDYSTIPKEWLPGFEDLAEAARNARRNQEYTSPTSTTQITVNVTSADPQAVVTALQKYARTIGPVPINTRTM